MYLQWVYHKCCVFFMETYWVVCAWCLFVPLLVILTLIAWLRWCLQISPLKVIFSPTLCLTHVLWEVLWYCVKSHSWLHLHPLVVTSLAVSCLPQLIITSMVAKWWISNTMALFTFSSCLSTTRKSLPSPHLVIHLKCYDCVWIYGSYFIQLL